MRRPVIFCIAAFLALAGCSGDSPGTTDPTCPYAGLEGLKASDSRCIKPMPIVATLDSIPVQGVLADLGTFPRADMTIRAIWSTASGKDSAQTPTFPLEKMFLTVPRGTQGVTLRAVGGSGYWDIERNVSSQCYKNNLQSFELIPRVYTMRNGPAAGQSVSISPDVFFKKASADDPLSYFQVGTWNGPAGCSAYSMPYGWLTETVQIGWNSTRSDVVLTEAQLSFLERGIEIYNQKRGKTKFTFVRSSAPDLAEGTADIIVGNNPRTSPGIAFVTHNSLDGDGDIHTGRVTLPSLLYLDENQMPVLIHELSHLAGIGHTCEFRTLMNSTWPLGKVNCEGKVSYDFTVEDLAYQELAESIRSQALKTQVLYGIVSSYQTNFNPSFSPQVNVVREMVIH